MGIRIKKVNLCTCVWGLIASLLSAVVSTVSVAATPAITVKNLDKAFYESVIDQIPASFRVFVKNTDEVYLACSATFASSLGKSVDEIVGKTDDEITTAADAKKYQKDDQAVMRSGKPELNYKELALNPAGKQEVVVTSKAPLKDKTGKVVGVIGVSYPSASPLSSR